jgi:hypothetical protein
MLLSLWQRIKGKVCNFLTIQFNRFYLLSTENESLYCCSLLAHGRRLRQRRLACYNCRNGIFFSGLEEMQPHFLFQGECEEIRTAVIAFSGLQACYELPKLLSPKLRSCRRISCSYWKYGEIRTARISSSLLQLPEPFSLDFRRCSRISCS